MSKLECPQLVFDYTPEWSRKFPEMTHQIGEKGAVGIKKHIIQTGNTQKSEAHSNTEDFFPKRKTESNKVAS